MSRADTADRLAEYLRLNPDTTAIEAVGHVGADPARWVDPVEDALAADTPHAALATPAGDDADGRTDTDTAGSPDDAEEDPAPDRSTPGVEADKAGSATAEPAADADFNQQSDPEDGGVLVNDAGGRTDADPTPGEDALADGLRWFTAQLDRELPDAVEHDTPRDYYHARGWSDATIDAKGLGYAPSDTGDRLLAHLHRRGHDRDAILASGLFREWDDGNLSATWTGRYVLPYLDADGRPVFAISRATEPAHPSDWAGRYGEDDDPAKYHKIAVSREEVTVEEPIYGLDTIRDGEPVLITEGIADAIAAHQAGYPCISPVTTSFKTEDREQLVDAIEEYAVPRVYLVQDAERPGSSVDDRDRLTLPQHGEGTKGAVRTAEYLAEHGTDARIGDLPRPGLDKVDLDDYLRVWADDLAPILAGATPVEEHPAHDPDAAKRAAIDAAERADLSGSPASGSGEGSALFDLDITDVTGLSVGFRGTSPLGHHGESENYFTLLDDGLAFDHKHKAAYNALTYLLVDAGERPPERPNGRIDDAELLAAWVHAKRERLIAEDDPIPRRALQAVARDATDWDGELVEHETADGDTFDGLARDVYNDALNAVREEYDLDPGRRPAGARSDPDAEPVAPIPLGQLDALDDDARRRAARKRADIPSTADARGRLRDAVFRELRAGNTTVVDAPTALGKTYGPATTPWRRFVDVTGGAPVIQFHQTREARDEAVKATADSAATGATLLGRKEASPVARGDHDPVADPDAEDAPDQVVTIGAEPASDWFDRMCDDRGLPFSTALAIARARNDQGLDELPPFGEEDPAVAQWNDLPRDDDGEPAVDVIHATHQFAHVPSLRTHTNVILDEQPDYRIDLSDQQVRDMVNAYLRAIDAPVSHFEGFVMLARNDAARGDAAAERDALDDALGSDADLPTEWYAEADGAHALAPDLARAIWNALRWEEPNRNGLRSTKVYHEPPRFDADNEGYAAGTWLSVVLDDADHSVHTVRATPDFSQARAVVGLDAHPSMPMWELNGPPGVTRDAVLDPTERRLWRRYERGLTVAQIGDAARPRSGPDAAEWMNDERVRTLLDRLREHYGDGFKTALSTVQTEPALRRLLADVTESSVEEVRDQTMHAGEEKSRNDFAEEDAGYVYGCMDPGDEMIVDALAELGLDAEPVTVETEDGEEKREKGRTFDGPDADKAGAVLASVRENHVAQEAGRYARNPSDPESRATVYVDTNAAPAGFVDLEVPGVEWLASDLQRTIVEELSERPTATTRELADAADCTKEHVRKTLDRLETNGMVEREERAGPHGADVYRDAGADAGIVDLGETTNDPLLDSNRWSLAICDRHAREEDADPPGGPSSTPIDAVGAGDTPPDPGD